MLCPQRSSVGNPSVVRRAGLAGPAGASLDGGRRSRVASNPPGQAGGLPRDHHRSRFGDRHKAWDALKAEPNLEIGSRRAFNLTMHARTLDAVTDGATYSPDQVVASASTR